MRLTGVKEPTINTFTLLVVAITLGVYSPLGQAGFVSLDDPAYVSSNPFVRQGLGWDSVGWAFRADLIEDTRLADYWQPVTFLSRLLDATLFGMDPTGHHLTSLLLHVANVVLLLRLLYRLTGNLPASVIAALLFAVHPLRVESVAWITERKDVLCGFFWLIGLWLYASYVRTPRLGRYLGVMVALALAMMSKPMAITFPVTLLLLDYWPLMCWPDEGLGRRAGILARLIEKVPLMVLAVLLVGFCWSTQGSHVGESSMGITAAKVLKAYVIYLVKSAIPSGLSVWHPPWAHISPGETLGCLAVLLGISGLVFWQRSRRPYLLVGWLWFLVTLQPMILLRDIAWAERFMYIPSIGLALMVAWWIPCRREQPGRKLGFAEAGLVLAVFSYGVGTYLRATCWRDSRTLYNQTLKVAPNCALIRLALARLDLAEGRREEAILQMRQAIDDQPAWVDPHALLGYTYCQMGRKTDALKQYEMVLRLEPEHAVIHHLLGLLLAEMGRTDEAIARERFALRLNPLLSEAHNNLGALLVSRRQVPEGVGHLRRAVEQNPDYAMARYNLGKVLLREGRFEKGVFHLREAVRLQPDFFAAMIELAAGLAGRREKEGGDLKEAERWARRACVFSRNQEPRPFLVLATVLADQGRYREAIEEALQARELAAKKGRRDWVVEIERKINALLLAARQAAGKPIRGN